MFSTSTIIRWVAVFVVAGPLGIINAFVLLPIASSVGLMEIVQPVKEALSPGIYNLCIYGEREQKVVEFDAERLQPTTDFGQIDFIRSFDKGDVTHGQEVGSKKQVSAVKLGVLKVKPDQHVRASLGNIDLRVGYFVSLWKIPVVIIGVIGVSVLESFFLVRAVFRALNRRNRGTR
jgi:hypothetical protein